MNSPNAANEPPAGQSPPPSQSPPAPALGTAPANVGFTPADVARIFQQWAAPIGAIFVSALSATAAFHIPVLWGRVLAGAFTATLLVIAYLTRPSNAPPGQQSTREQPPAGSAFRNLQRFRRGDVLPGKVRRQIAGNLFATVRQDGFQLHIVTGDVGCGKSSLLECALLQPMEDIGFSVAMVSGLPDAMIVECDQASAPVGPGDSIWRQISDWVTRRAQPGHTKTLLILDQFEDILFALDSVTEQQKFGQHLRRALMAGWRVVIGIRRDHVPGLQDIARQLTRRIMLDEDVLYIHNFDASEASDVIKECADRDSIPCTREMRERLARDLTINGEVRPTDLQIVCSELRSDMTLTHYQVEGGVAGLRAKFITDMMQLAGSEELTKAILRQLCDFHNNRKTPPLSLDEILKCVRVSLPSRQITREQVLSTCVQLEQALIVMRPGGSTVPQWILFHDYLVEPIKLATEDAEVMRDSARAELEAFRTQQARFGWRIVIPRYKLKQIRRSLPRAELSGPGIRSLIIRSLLVGYGRPLAVYAMIFLVAVLSVMLLSTKWHVWRAIGDPTKNALGIGTADAGFIEGWRTKARDGYDVIIGPPTYAGVSGTVYTMWDASDGQWVGRYPGAHSSIAMSTYTPNTPIDPSREDLYLWSYNPHNGKLARYAGDYPTWKYLVPQSARPPSGYIVSGYQSENPEDGVLFEQPSCSPEAKPCAWIVTPRSNAGRSIDRGLIAPTAAAAAVLQAPLVYQMFFTKGVRGWIAERADNRAWVTLWTFGMTRRLCDKQFDGDIALLGIAEIQNVVYVSVLSTASNVVHTLSTALDGSLQTGAAECSDAPTPWPVNNANAAATATSSADGLNFTGVRGVSQILATPNRVLIRSDEPTRTIIWPLDLAKGKFDEPIIAESPAPHVENAMVWMMQGGGVGVWSAAAKSLTRLEDISISSKDEVVFDDHFEHLLRITPEGVAHLWEVSLARGTATEVLHVGSPGFTTFSFSDDQHALIGRKRGGELVGWSLQGRYLGVLGDVGSHVIWSSYDSGCGRMLLWTAEGQILDLRVGIDIPMFGFSPQSKCRRATANDTAVAQTAGGASHVTTHPVVLLANGNRGAREPMRGTAVAASR